MLLGRDRGIIADALAAHAPQVPVTVIETSDADEAMREAVAAANAAAQRGDTVLLAPAAASLDMYASYGARGDAFADAVAALSGSGA